MLHRTAAAATAATERSEAQLGKRRRTHSCPERKSRDLRPCRASGTARTLGRSRRICQHLIRSPPSIPPVEQLHWSLGARCEKHGPRCDVTNEAREKRRRSGWIQLLFGVPQVREPLKAQPRSLQKRSKRVATRVFSFHKRLRLMQVPMSLCRSHGACRSSTRPALDRLARHREKRRDDACARQPPPLSIC